jgi:predicted alpha/beta superfamily hydrolase
MPPKPVLTNPQPPAPGTLAARLHKHEQFVSRLVEENHDLLVYLPPGYEAQGEGRFPVLYMQDGQNLFDPETSFIKGNYWRMGETADALIEAGAIEPLIIVGIYNTGDKRIDEYTPVEDKRLGGGHADAYGRMLVEELKPFIDAQYQTLPGPENCGMGGSSLGGLVTLYLPAGRRLALGLVAKPRDSQNSCRPPAEA